MGDQDNSIRTTRAAVKRAASWPSSMSEKRSLLRAKKKGQKTMMVKDIEENSDDPQMCAPYASDIYEYLHSMEVKETSRPLHDYFERIQQDLTPGRRGMLVDWLVGVAEKYRLVPETLYRTVSYIDRFLSLNAVTEERLRLLGVSCMLIASKYEENKELRPDVEDFCKITEHNYTKQEVVNMEKDILVSLNFEMGNPTTETFLKRFTRVLQENCKFRNVDLVFLCRYLAELSLLDYGCVRFLPSMVAASAIFLSKLTIQPNEHPWDSTLQQLTGYRPSDLKNCVNAIHDLQLNRTSPSFVAIRNKYKEYSFKCVARLTSPSEIPTTFFEDVNR